MPTPIDVGSLITSPLRLLYRDQELGSATGYFAERAGQLFLVTNWHVVTGRDFQTGHVLHPEQAIPDRVRFLVGCQDHDGEWMDANILLYEDANENQVPEHPRWLEHAVHRRNVDVIALPFGLPDGAAIRTYSQVNTVPRMLVKVAQSAIVLGYPVGMSGGRGFPIWKRASIATEPAINLDGLPKMLVDTATRKGMSGAPVIVIADGEFDVEGPPPAYRPPGRAYRFLGTYSGRLGGDEMQAQLGIVWKERALLDILEAPTLGQSSFLL